ncbi:MAG: hypothetical protein UGA93_01080, partial [Gemmiger formicilis]|uniref:hypothetical protein n=1 Tax=Gemmiger formicilis TaxID=745368 RepID=UPI002E763BC2
RLRHGICVAKMLDNTQSIICAFGLAAAAPRSPYRHLELCGIALYFFASLSGKMILLTKKKISIKMSPLSIVVPML